MARIPNIDMHLHINRVYIYIYIRNESRLLFILKTNHNTFELDTLYTFNFIKIVIVKLFMIVRIDKAHLFVIIFL